MSADESVAALLRRAADRVEELAKGAAANVCPAWTYQAVRHISRNVDIDCSHDPAVDDGLNHAGWNRYDGPWIALMGPQIASPLASWLRAEADQLERDGWEETEDDYPATALALALLGETPEPKEVDHA